MEAQPGSISLGIKPTRRIRRRRPSPWLHKKRVASAVGEGTDLGAGGVRLPARERARQRRRDAHGSLHPGQAGTRPAHSTHPGISRARVGVPGRGARRPSRRAGARRCGGSGRSASPRGVPERSHSALTFQNRHTRGLASPRHRAGLGLTRAYRRPSARRSATIQSTRLCPGRRG